MCILFVALEVHPQYPLILCANRDEFHHRPTEPAHFWPPDNQLLAGKDLEAGGSWLGVNRRGDIAALTNIRAPELHEAVKAGKLTHNIASKLADAPEEDQREVLEAYHLDSLSFGPEYIIPKPLDPRLREHVATAVKQAAIDSGVARI